MKAHQPLVSIGMPVYNGERFITEALDSIIDQSFEDFELIISDNASTDRTEEICRTYVERDKRVRYVRNEENIGVNRNFNHVFRLSSGEYFKWASADDICSRALIARCLEVLEDDPSVVLVYPKTQFINEIGGMLNWNDPGWDLSSDNIVERLRYVIYSGHWVNVFYGLTRAKALSLTRLFPPYDSGDYRLIGELCLRGRFLEIPDYLFFRRIHPKASSQNTGLEWQSQFFKGDRGGIDLPFWHLSLDHSKTILSSELNAWHKVACLIMILKRMRWERHQLLNELRLAAKYYVNRGFPNLS